MALRTKKGEEYKIRRIAEAIEQGKIEGISRKDFREITDPELLALYEIAEMVYSFKRALEYLSDLVKPKSEAT
ncbi:MAG: hypothetical protein ACP5O8_03330 [Candidatus Aenigmatarchaeota archaeon]